MYIYFQGLYHPSVSSLSHCIQPVSRCVTTSPYLSPSLYINTHSTKLYHPLSLTVNSPQLISLIPHLAHSLFSALLSTSPSATLHSYNISRLPLPATTPTPDEYMKSTPILHSLSSTHSSNVYSNVDSSIHSKSIPCPFQAYSNVYFPMSTPIPPYPVLSTPLPHSISLAIPFLLGTSLKILLSDCLFQSSSLYPRLPPRL